MEFLGFEKRVLGGGGMRNESEIKKKYAGNKFWKF
jgi:hypothetical protein